MFEPRLKVPIRYPFVQSPHSTHAKIIELVGSGKRVLDVGCGAGYLSKELKKNGCYVVGIEIDKEAAEIAKNILDAVIVADVEEIRDIPYREGFFDVIVFADVLEHLKRPDKVLLKFKSYLSKDGYAVASIPNIANWHYRLSLLFGRFDYEESGILDKTHLRFFTLKTAKGLFESTGYKIVHVDYTGLASKNRLFRLFPTIFAYQFIIVAKPL
jgi:2-polyprenyl-3-methyl-5-hydroxy-6-metoxy-1,4-benzoquinol methylase